MKSSALIMAAIFSCLLLVASPCAAQDEEDPPVAVVPEPATIVMLAGMAGVGGAAYLWRRVRQK